MLGVGADVCARGPAALPVALPAGLEWDTARFPLAVERLGGRYRAKLAPRALVDPAIWSGPAFHVDVEGDDANSGVGAQDGDFSAAKRTIHAAFTAGNATGGAYRVLVKAGLYEESAFTRNGNVEPSQPVAILGWGGRACWRAGPENVAWSDAGSTFSTQLSAVNRVFRTDLRTPRGHWTELERVPDLPICQATAGTWYRDSETVHVNIGKPPGPGDVVPLRGFHGARFLTHAHDLYLENIDCQGGITGALHCDAVAARNVVGVDCTFRYATPPDNSAPLDAARVRRTNGLVAFFGCDASFGAKDGWSFHEDGQAGMHVLLQDCTGHDNGTPGASSCNAFTSHDGCRAVVLGGDFGHSRNGTEVHCIQETRTWVAGARAVARDTDGTSVAFKCSNLGKMWLQDTVADAAGDGDVFAVEANGGTIYTRRHRALSGAVAASNGGVVVPF